MSRSATRAKTIFGQTFSSPFGISPTGGAGLFRYHADPDAGRGGARRQHHLLLSGASSDAIEAAAKVVPRNHWYQRGAREQR